MRNKHRAELGINGTDPNTNYRWIGCNNVAGYNNAAQSKGNESEIFGGENMVMIGVVRHKAEDFADWKRKFDERMIIRKSNGWSGHELYYDEKGKDAYVVHTVNDDKVDMAKQHMAKFKALGKRNEMNPSGNPDHSIMPKGNKIESMTY